MSAKRVLISANLTLKVKISIQHRVERAHKITNQANLIPKLYKYDQNISSVHYDQAKRIFKLLRYFTTKIKSKFVSKTDWNVIFIKIFDTKICIFLCKQSCLYLQNWVRLRLIFRIWVKIPLKWSPLSYHVVIFLVFRQLDAWKPLTIYTADANCGLEHVH